MKRVRAGLGVEVDHATGESSILRAKVVCLYFEFLNGILRGDHCDYVEISAICRRAVDEDLALPGLASADLKISQSEGICADWTACRGIARRGLTLWHNARHNCHQRQRVASIQRKLGDTSLFDDLPERVRFGLEQRHFRSHLDCFGLCSNRQLDIHPESALDLHEDWL